MIRPIAIAITTKDRPDLLAKALQYHEKFLPPGAAVVVVDDGSVTPVRVPHWVQLIRHEETLGISESKNRCLEAVMPWADHIFLFDDDSWPTQDDWYRPYVESPEPHLQANYGPAVSRWAKITEFYRTPHLVAHHCGRGHMLYFERRAIERVGGFDTRFKLGFEHMEVSERVHAARLTSFAYQDVPGSEQFIHWADAEESPPDSSIPRLERRMLNQENLELFVKLKGRDTYVPYLQQRDVVLTCLFSTTPDPQWGHVWKSDPSIVGTLLHSLMVHGVESEVFYDDPKLTAPGNNWQLIERGVCDPYIQRWVTYRNYLTHHPEIRWAWCVDGSDVELLQDPFGELEPGVLCVGYEDEICGKPWMIEKHDASREWLEANATKTLLNPGVVGGDRNTLLMLCDRLIGLYTESVVKEKTDRPGDMGFFQRVVYGMNYRTGPRIVTPFKRYERNGHSMWLHK